MALRVGAQAQADIREIASFIAEHDRLAARSWEARITKKLTRLGEMSGIGAPRFEVRPRLRILPVNPYLVLYHQDGTDAEVVHGARQWAKLLPDP